MATRRGATRDVMVTARRLTHLGLALVCALLVSGLVTSCSASTTGNFTKVDVARTCTTIADVLSDGPDPDVDPVGYALAQVRPLRAITTRDAALHGAIDGLASAYEKVVTTNNSKSARKLVAHAAKAVDAICPGAA